MVLGNESEGRGRACRVLLPYAMYGCFTAAAMALEQNNLPFAAGLVLLAAAAVMAGLFYREEHSLVSFRFLLSVFWIAGEGLGVMRLSRLQTAWTLMSWFSFTGFYLMFLAGYQIVLLRKRTGDSVPEKVFADDRLFQCIRAVSLLSFLTFAAEAVILGYVPLFSSLTHAYDHFHISGVHYFTVSCMFTHSLTLIYLLRNKKQVEKKKKRELILLNILSASIPVLCVSKFQFILTLALPILIYLLMRPQVNRRRLFGFLTAAAFAAAAAAVFMTVRRNYEPGYLDSIFQMKDEGMPLFLQYGYMYIANNYSNFNCLTQAIQSGAVTHALGLRQLFPVFALTGLKFVFPSLVSFAVPTTITELNTLTLIYDAYYDFGLTGVLLFGLILGGVCALLAVRTEKGGNPIIYLFYAQIALYLVLSFFSAWFTVPTTWFWFAVTGILYFYTSGSFPGIEKKKKL